MGEGKLEKKRLKIEAKLRKKQAKTGAAPTSAGRSGGGRSVGVRYAESVRGALYVLSGASLVVAILLGQRDAVVSLDDVIENLFVATAGKIVLGLIGLAMLIYGLKTLRLLR